MLYLVACSSQDLSKGNSCKTSPRFSNSILFLCVGTLQQLGSSMRMRSLWTISWDFVFLPLLTGLCAALRLPPVKGMGSCLVETFLQLCEVLIVGNRALSSSLSPPNFLLDCWDFNGLVLASTPTAALLIGLMLLAQELLLVPAEIRYLSIMFWDPRPRSTAS